MPQQQFTVSITETAWAWAAIIERLTTIAMITIARCAR